MAKTEIFVCKSTNVKLRITAPSSWAMLEAQKTIADQEPQPPMVMVEAKGREEPNESDPTYKRERERWVASSSQRTYTVLVVTGTELVKKPDDIYGPDDEEFVEYLEVMGIEPEQKTLARYAQWVRTYAARASEDWQSLMQILMRAAGTPEEAVAEAAESFRDNTERGADTPSLAE